MDIKTKKLLFSQQLKPVNPAHMLIVPKIHAPYLADMDEETTLHVIQFAGKVSEAIRRSEYKCEGINWFLADGEAAEQEVLIFISMFTPGLPVMVLVLNMIKLKTLSK